MNCYFRLFLITSLLFNVNLYANDSMVTTDNFQVIKYDQGVVSVKVLVCPESAPVDVGIKFNPSSQPKELSFAEIEVHVPEFQCYALTYREVQVDLKKLIKDEAMKKSVQSSTLVLKSLPLRLGVTK